MKSLLIAGALLMTGAAIYGFIDYKKISHRVEFRNMYGEEKKGVSINKEALPAIQTSDVKEESIEMEKAVTDSRKTKSSTVENNRGRKVSREFELEKFSRAPLKEFPKKNPEKKQ